MSHVCLMCRGTGIVMETNEPCNHGAADGDDLLKAVGAFVEPFTEAEVERWCDGTIGSHMLSRLTDILNGTYKLEEAREDVRSFR